MERKNNRIKDKAERKEARQDKRADRKQARKSKPKKAVDISIDGKKVDVDIERDESGNVSVDVDAQKFDASFKKTADKISLEVEIEDGETYLFESNGSNRRLPKGAFWKLTGAVIKTFLRRGWGKLKK